MKRKLFRRDCDSTVTTPVTAVKQWQLRRPYIP
jgi:hypothetical protein